MKSRKEKIMQLFRQFSVFFAVFFSCMLGATFFRVSVNKIALIPLLICLIIDKKNWHGRPTVAGILYLVFAISSLISCVSGLIFANELSAVVAASANKSLYLFLAQILIFNIPIFVLMLTNKEKYIYLNLLKKDLVIVARINLAWLFLQTACYYVGKIDINKLILKPIFYPDYESPLTRISSFGLFLRASGLTHDPAIFGIVLIIGFCFDKNWIFKLLYFCGSILTISRSTIATIGACLILLLIFNWKKISKNTKILLGAGFLILLGISFAIPSTRNLLLATIHRFNFFSNPNDGTNRHLLYPVLAFQTLFTKSNFLTFLFGYGPRNSGTALAYFISDKSFFGGAMLTSAWSTECDISETLLGYGFIGFLLFYSLLFVIAKQNKGTLRLFIIALFIYGFMYNIAAATIIHLILIIGACCPQKYSYPHKIVI